MAKSRQAFRSSNDISSAIKILNSDLTILNFPLISKHEDAESTILQLANLCFDLTTAIKKNHAQLNRQLEDLLRCQATLENEKKGNTRLAQSLENEKKKVTDLNNQLKLNVLNVTQLQKQVKAGEKQISQLQHAITVQRLRHEHESRRREAIISSLKNRIYLQYSNEIGPPHDKPTLKCNSILTEGCDEIIDKYVCQLHNNLQVVLEENVKYRTAIETIYNSISIEVIDMPTSTLVDLSGLSCDGLLKIVENNFCLILEQLFKHTE